MDDMRDDSLWAGNIKALIKVHSVDKLGMIIEAWAKKNLEKK